MGCERCEAPLFSVVVALTLALGIGANTAIFTLIDCAASPFAIFRTDRLVLGWEDTSMFGLKDSPAALGNYVDWREQNPVFEEMGAPEDSSFRLTGAGEPQQLEGIS